MSEIYQEKLARRRNSYMGREIALRETVELVLDKNRFTLEEMQASLSELHEIANAESIETTYLMILADRIFKEK